MIGKNAKVRTLAGEDAVLNCRMQKIKIAEVGFGYASNESLAKKGRGGTLR